MIMNKSMQNDELNFREIFYALNKSKLKISLLSIFIFIPFLFISFFSPNIYKSSAVLASTSDSANSFSKLASSYSSLASIAGISVPSSGEVDEIAASIEIMNSFNFFEDFVNEYDLFFILEAHNGWDKRNNELIVDSSKYDLSSKSWISNDKFSINGKPSMQSAHRRFTESFSATIDKKTGFITLSYEHYSPYVAKDILDKLIKQINLIKKNQDIKFAQDSITFLKNEANNANIKEIKEVINALIQKQIETITLANAAPEYLMKQLSRPIAPELKSSPNRALMVVLGFLFSIILSFSYVLIEFFYLKNKESQ